MKTFAWIVGFVGVVWLVGGKDILIELLLEMLFVMLIVIPATLVVLDAMVIFKMEETR